MKIETIRHSLSHILAYAVQELYPGTKFGMGPATERGFYYDFDLPRALIPAELPKIEKKMKEIIKKNIPFKKQRLSKSDSNRLFKEQPYKLELIKELPGKTVTIYESGDFVDFCKGPHAKSTKEISPDSFKLTKIAGAYWRGSERNPMLTRIYGLAFQTKKELENYLLKEKEAEERDHRLLGQKLELFSFDEEVGAGLPLWHPKGAVLRKTIEDYLYQELISQGYQFIVTPHIGKLDLWKSSGHWELYREDMYSPIDIEGEKFLLKPMNCPFHVKIYQKKIHSYRELPLKYAEFGTVYRYEKSGVLHGLIRVRGFTQDDAHIFCTSEQVSQELTKLLKYGLKTLKTFGFKDFNIYLATRPKKYAGAEKEWQKATNSLRYILEKSKLKYQLDPGGGVFYGPKIDAKVKDSLGREWQCITIQFDFNLPERFNVTYINKKGKKERPFMIHRALIGSFERFIGVLLEHYGGALPLWLSPVQVWVIPVGTRHQKYSKEATKKLSDGGARWELKDENETVSKKIRDGELQKIPYLLVVGDKEMKTKSVRVRSKNKDLGPMKLTKFIKRIKLEIENKKSK
jgi:threonyl-tRNA synthetase